MGAGPLADRLKVFKNQYDHFRSAVVNEPRGSDVIVGALLCEPLDVKSAAAVIFFNNVGYLGMCGHGTIGVIATLQFLNRIGPGEHKIETPVGTVSAVLHDDRQVTVHNIESFRSAANVEVIVAEYGTVRGDVAWGGNWFFLVRDQRSDLTLAKLDRLTDFTWAVRQALRRTVSRVLTEKKLTISNSSAPPKFRESIAKTVLCPGRAYDRSPCGTGTSAKLACLYADGKIKEGQIWKQESIVGSVFEGSVSVRDGKVFPSIKGAAFVNAEAELLLDPADPLCMGIRA